MFRSVVLGALMALVSSVAVAAGPLFVTTAFPTGIPDSDPFKANLATIGVGMDLAAPANVQVLVPTQLNFRLLESRPTGATEVNALVVDGTTYGVTPQAFSPAGTPLGSQLFSGQFIGDVGFRLTNFAVDEPALFWPIGFHLYMRSADAGNLSGIGPFIGHFDTLYFSVSNVALFEVSAANVPEPESWGLLILGFLGLGTMIRLSRARPAAA